MIISDNGYFVFDVTNMELLKIYKHLLKAENNRGINLERIIKPKLGLKESAFNYFDLNEEERHFKYDLKEYLERKKKQAEKPCGQAFSRAAGKDGFLWNI